MKVTTKISSQHPEIVSVVTFNPWPFQENRVETTIKLYWDGYDLDSVSTDEPWVLNENDNTIVTFSDGTSVICEEADVAKLDVYVRSNGLRTEPHR